MNEKEAREVLQPFEAYKVFPIVWLPKDAHGNPSGMATAEAKGYLEAFDKAKGLEEALKRINNRKQYSCECIGEDCSCDFSDMQFIAKEALAKYHSIK